MKNGPAALAKNGLSGRSSVDFFVLAVASFVQTHTRARAYFASVNKVDGDGDGQWQSLFPYNLYNNMKIECNCNKQQKSSTSLKRTAVQVIFGADKCEIEQDEVHNEYDSPMDFMRWLSEPTTTTTITTAATATATESEAIRFFHKSKKHSPSLFIPNKTYQIMHICTHLYFVYVYKM